jgi:hypothetical protein
LLHEIAKLFCRVRVGADKILHRLDQWVVHNRIIAQS